MTSINEFEKNWINHRDGTYSESGDELSTGCLSCEVVDDSSDENSAESIYQDYFNARNYFRFKGNWLAHHRAILDRAYNFIYDEAFSSESTNESESSYMTDVDNNCSRKHEWANDNLAGENGEEDHSSRKNFSPVLKSKKTRGNSTGNSVNKKSRSRQKAWDEKMENFADRNSVYPSSSSPFEQRSRNTSRSQLADNLSQSLSNSSDFLSENLNFEESLENCKIREFTSKKYQEMQKKPGLETIGIRRKRKSSTATEFRDRLIYSQDNLHTRNGENNYHVRNPSARIPGASKLRHRLKPISKIRKIYSEQILLEKLHEENSRARFLGADDSSSNDSLVIDVEEILQDNIRGKNIRFTAETILMEKKIETKSKLLSFQKSGKMKNLFRPYNHANESHANEVKLLGDIKKRIDEDFECDISRSKLIENLIDVGGEMSLNTSSTKCPGIISASLELGKSGENLINEKKLSSKIVGARENRKSVSLDKVTDYDVARNSDIIYSNNHDYYPPLKCSSRNFVHSIDSGVSADFSRNESDLSKTNCECDEDKNESPVIADRIPVENDEGPAAVASLSYPNSSNRGEEEDEKEEPLEEEVEKAVEKFTEELIMFERRAVERGLIDEIRRKSSGRKRKKPIRQARYSDSSSPKTCNTFSSPRDFFNTSQSSGEEEYLENISPPSLTSISDSDV